MHHDEDMPRISLNGTELMYFDEGRGDPLVLVHGSVSDYRTWELQRRAFAERFRVITYSRRYHWPNAPISDGDDYVMAEHVDDLEALVEHLGLAPLHLVGHSYGAFLCLLLAIRKPQWVRRLVLAEPPVVPLFLSNPPRPWQLIQLLLRHPRTAAAIFKIMATGFGPATRAFKRGDTETGLRRVGEAIFGRAAFENFKGGHGAQITANTSATVAEFLGPGFEPLDVDSVRAVSMPTLLVNGQESRGIFHRLTDRLAELMPNTQRVWIPRASHGMHETNDQAFNAAVLTFLRPDKTLAQPDSIR